MHIQIFRPGQTASGAHHVWLGRLTMTFLTIGTVAALYLASEHDAVSPYGGIWAEWGFYSMSLCVYVAVRLRRGGYGLAHGYSERLGATSRLDDSLCWRYVWRYVWRFLAISCAADRDRTPVTRVGERIAVDFRLGFCATGLNTC